MLTLKLAATVHIGVLGSFHPVQLQVQPARGSVLMVETQGHTAILQGSQSIDLTGPSRVAGRSGSPVRFKLAIPGRVEREYLGRLEVRNQGGELLAIVEMDRETAVAAIMEAEGAGAMPLEARKAQAVVIRSYLAAAKGRHDGYDFCDSTHCQLLGNPPPEISASARAAETTRGQVLVYRGAIIAATYFADCGGQTKTLEQAGWSSAGVAYPYFSVACPRHGKASGHGIGLCQMGAIEIARHGWPARIILMHYFPETTIASLDATTPQVHFALVSAMTNALPNAGMGVHAVR